MTNSSPWYRWPIYRWFSYEKWWFSMAMLNNQMAKPHWTTTSSSMGFPFHIPFIFPFIHHMFTIFSYSKTQFKVYKTSYSPSELNVWIRIGGLMPTMLIWLVVYLPLWKNMKVSWDDDIPKIWNNKKCSKPPTSNQSRIFHYFLINVKTTVRC